MSFFRFILPLVVLLCSLVYIFTAPQQVFSHAAGLPSFFRVDGRIATASPLETVRAQKSGFDSAQDVAHRTYMVGESVQFAIDTVILQPVYPEDVFATMLFAWDFGDKTNGSGNKNSHVYTKPGSYFLTVKAHYGKEVAFPELIESIMIDVVPDASYELPQAKIKINGKLLNDPLKDSHKLNLEKELVFDATDSTAPSSKIVEYIWDFGDGNTSTEPVVRYKYSKNHPYISPTLRIKDEHGLMAYAFADIITFDTLTPSGTSQTSTTQNNTMFAPVAYLFPITAAFIGVALLPGVIGKLKKRKKH